MADYTALVHADIKRVQMIVLRARAGAFSSAGTTAKLLILLTAKSRKMYQGYSGKSSGLTNLSDHISLSLAHFS